MRRSQILGIGSFAPDRVVTNQDLTQWMETTDAWIVERTGIRERRWVEEGKGIGSSDLGVEAAQRALVAAEVDKDQIQMVIFATLSPDHDFPGTGCFFQRKLGLKPMPVLDVRQQCTGFIYALSVADAYVKSGFCDYVLVVGAEVHSTGIDISTRGRDVAVLFGDAGGAAVVGPAREPDRGILSTHLYADGNFAEDLWVDVPSSRNHPRLSHQDLEAGINEFVQKQLGLPDSKIHNNIDRYGNTTAATIPLCMDEALRIGKIRRGDLVCLAAFGAGFTWGAALLRW